MGSRAQVSIEFFIFIGLAFLIAIGFQIASLDQLKDFRQKNEDETVKDIALRLQRELLIASSVEDGYFRTFNMPDAVNRFNYTLNTQNSTLIVESKNSFYSIKLPKATGNFSKGANSVNKSGGVIYIN